MQSNSINILICDRESAMLEQLRNICYAILGQNYQLQVWTTTLPDELEHYKEPFDIVLLAMQFPDTDGVQLARILLERNPSCQIIFVSGVLSSVSRVYEVPHLGMVLKDQLDKYLPHFLRRAAALVIDTKRDSIQIVNKKEQIALPLARIAAIERIGHWTYFHMIDQGAEMPITDKLRTREKIGDLLERIGSPRFARSHISYIVNLANVQELQKHGFMVHIADGQSMYIPISRYYDYPVRNAFFQFLSNKSIKTAH